MWEYREDNGSYTRYSAEHSALLEAAATEGRDMLELRSSQAAYTVMIDYGKGGVTQINNTTGSTREVRCLPPLRPAASPAAVAAAAANNNNNNNNDDDAHFKQVDIRRL